MNENIVLYMDDELILGTIIELRQQHNYTPIQSINSGYPITIPVYHKSPLTLKFKFQTRDFNGRINYGIIYDTIPFLTEKSKGDLIAAIPIAIAIDWEYPDFSIITFDITNYRIH